jgi:hypothetical protein
VDFAREIFRALNLYSPAAIESWYAMFRHCDASRHYALAS